MRYKLSKSILTIFFMLSIMLVIAHLAAAQNSQETLNQYIADLQKNPDDNALREKVIRLVQEMTPAPVLPEDAQKHLDRGVAAIEGAKSEEDFKDACTEFTEVLTIAPWFGRGYRPLAVAQDKSGQYDAALKNLEFYLLSQPSSEDVAWAKSLINKIEYRKEKAAKETSPEIAAAKKEDDYETWLKNLDGERFLADEIEMGDQRGYPAIEIRGNEVVFGFVWTARRGNSTVPIGIFQENTSCAHAVIKGREFSLPANGIAPGENFTIDEDGKKITAAYANANGVVMVYRRK
jgi:hypothetical protein